MSDFPLPSPHVVQIELAATNRKLTTAILGMTLLMGLVACLAYLAGRTVTRTIANQATETQMAQQRVAERQKPLVIEPSKAEIPNQPEKPASAPATAAACPTSTGDVYFQVGLINPGNDAGLVARIKQHGHAFKLAPMEGSQYQRVLIGPVNEAAQQEIVSAKLKEQGYTFFRRRW